MSHSLRAKLSGLRYKGLLEDKDYKRLCKALDNENVLDKIIAEIEQTANEEQKHDEKWAIGLRYAIKIIDKYRKDGD